MDSVVPRQPPAPGYWLDTDTGQILKMSSQDIPIDLWGTNDIIVHDLELKVWISVSMTTPVNEHWTHTTGTLESESHTLVARETN